jgi:hypothetical protein
MSLIENVQSAPIRPARLPQPQTQCEGRIAQSEAVLDRPAISSVRLFQAPLSMLSGWSTLLERRRIRLDTD